MAVPLLFCSTPRTIRTTSDETAVYSLRHKGGVGFELNNLQSKSKCRIKEVLQVGS